MAATELQGGGGRISITECTGESAVYAAVIPIASVLEMTLKIDAGDSVKGERSEAVQASGPISGDAERTSVSKGKVN